MVLFSAYFLNPTREQKYRGLKTQGLFSDRGVHQLADATMALNKVNEGVGA